MIIPRVHLTLQMPSKMVVLSLIMVPCTSQLPRIPARDPKVNRKVLPFATFWEAWRIAMSCHVPAHATQLAKPLRHLLHEVPFIPAPRAFSCASRLSLSFLLQHTLFALQTGAEILEFYIVPFSTQARPLAASSPIRCCPRDCTCLRLWISHKAGTRLGMNLIISGFGIVIGIPVAGMLLNIHWHIQF